MYLIRFCVPSNLTIQDVNNECNKKMKYVKRIINTQFRLIGGYIFYIKLHRLERRIHFKQSVSTKLAKHTIHTYKGGT